MSGSFRSLVFHYLRPPERPEDGVATKDGCLKPPKYPKSSKRSMFNDRAFNFSKKSKKIVEKSYFLGSAFFWGGSIPRAVVILVKVMTTPSILLSWVLYGTIRMKYLTPSLVTTFFS